MYFDWITWSIWLVGFIIMVIWIWIPIKEFKKLLHKKKQLLSEQNNNKSVN